MYAYFGNFKNSEREDKEENSEMFYILYLVYLKMIVCIKNYDRGSKLVVDFEIKSLSLLILIFLLFLSYFLIYCIIYDDCAKDKILTLLEFLLHILTELIIKMQEVIQIINNE